MKNRSPSGLSEGEFSEERMKTLGLYIHIPFCRSKCAYCDFYSLPGREDRMDAYCDALCRSAAEWGSRAGDYRTDTVYIGGGTPSWFGSGRIAAVLDAVRRSFRLTGDCEITMEANPDSVTQDGMRRICAAGVNRISLGVQSADDGELSTAGRPHSFADACRAVNIVRSAGIRNLSLDLIYGLPGQSMAGWRNSVERILALAPDHISCYGLKLEEGTPFWRDRDRMSFPDEDLQADEYLWLCERLKQADFAQYEISNFAKPGYASRHNLKYWTLGEYLGLGPGACSDFQGIRFGYARDLDGWIAGTCALSERKRIDPAERLEEYVMLGLRLQSGITRDRYQAFGGRNWEKLERLLLLYQKHGRMREDEGHWHCTPEGFLVSNALIGSLLDEL